MKPETQLSQNQLEVLRLSRTESPIQLTFEYPVAAANNFNSNYHVPDEITELSELGLIIIQNSSTRIRPSEFQLSSWSEFSKDISSPTQSDWDCWRNGFNPRMTEASEAIIPRDKIGEFTAVWQKRITIQAVELDR